MKILFYLFFSVVCVTGYAHDVPFHRLGYAFTQTNVPIIWEAPIHNLPSKLWIYRASPAKVSPDTISNLVALGAFTEKDRKKVPDYPHLIVYDNSSKKIFLRIDPNWAFISYRDSSADDSNITEGVPDERQAFQIATNWLLKLGIDRNQLVKSPSGKDLKFYGSPGMSYLYSREGNAPAYATNIFVYGITFKRSLDGAEIIGGTAYGGYSIQIGNHAKISNILVSWRNYKHDKCYPIASRKTLLKWIHEGKAVCWSGDQLIDWSSIKKITITKATPLYYSEAYDENDAPQNIAYPFAELEAQADTGATNLTFNFYCPIIEEAKAITKTSPLNRR
jgi:hypothetical protein